MIERIVNAMQTALPVSGGAAGGAATSYGGIKIIMAHITWEQAGDMVISSLIFTIIGGLLGGVLGFYVQRYLKKYYEKKKK